MRNMNKMNIFRKNSESNFFEDFSTGGYTRTLGSLDVTCRKTKISIIISSVFSFYTEIFTILILDKSNDRGIVFWLTHIFLKKLPDSEEFVVIQKVLTKSLERELMFPYQVVRPSELVG